MSVTYHADLSNGLGNLVSRLTTLCEQAGYGPYRPVACPQSPAGYREAWRERRLDRAIQALWKEVASLNHDIEAAQPWKALKTQECALDGPLKAWLDRLQSIAYWLEPFLPATSGEIVSKLASGEVRASEPLFPRRP